MKSRKGQVGAVRSGLSRLRETSAFPNSRTVSRRLPALLHRLVALLVDETGPYFRNFGITIPATRVIVTLLENGGAMTVGNLSDTLSIDLSTTSHILRRLEKQNYLSRQRQVHDNRLVNAVLTAEGKRVAEKCRSASLLHERALTAGMSAQEVAQLKMLLEQAYKNAKDGLGKIKL